MTQIPPQVAEKIQASAAPDTLRLIRQLILDTADATNTAPLEETLKWGEPAYVPARKNGTTIRLGATDSHAVLYVHCQTTLLDQYRERFPTEFTYDGNRAVLIPHDQPLNQNALAQIIALALTYHRNKARR